MRRPILKGMIVVATLASLLSGETASASETAFVYQGRLTDGLKAAEGEYDFLFRLYDRAEDGAPIGEAAAREDVDVAGGLFEVELDFGHDLFTGEASYLEIGVRAANEAADHASLAPRQAFIPVPGAWQYPYAIYAAEARSAAEGQGASITAVGIGEAGGEDISPLDAHGVGAGTGSVLHRDGLNTADGDYSSVGGGQYCYIGTGANHSTIAGGSVNKVYANGKYASIIGGANNSVGDNTRFGTVCGGEHNQVYGGAEWATVGGGDGNDATGDYATIAGGYDGKANGIGATIGGGRYNEASGTYSTVPGGRKNRAVNYCLAAGYRAKAAHRGSFVWGDVTEANLTTTANDQFLARAKGGFKFYTNAAMDTGAKLNSGSGSWTSVSDRDCKENFEPVDPAEILERLSEVPVRTWNYKAQDDAIRHIGPMSQDLYAAFALGADDKGIATIDGIGLSLAAAKGLYELAQENRTALQAKDARIRSLEERLAILEEALGSQTQ
jgi:hypothetical protein